MPTVQNQPTGPAPDLVGAQIGRFTVESRLGAGGMGEVYRAYDTRLKRAVAIKRMAPDLHKDQRYRERLLQEAERASALNHPNLAGIYDVLEHDGELFLVMELVEGHTLRKRLRETITAHQFLEIARACAEGLAAAHEKGVVHCDLKPDNIMITGSGQIKVLDFGLAKRAVPAATSNTPTITVDSYAQYSGGTPAYMAPEVLLGAVPQPSADIFSLGVVFYELLSGRNPFYVENVFATANRVVNERVRSLREVNPAVPPAVDHVIMRMLAKDPSERYPDGRALLADLNALQQGITRTDFEMRRPAAATGRRLTVAVAVLTLIVAAVALGWYLRARQPKTTAPPTRRHVAVLPFRVIGESTQAQVYAQGLIETLTARLTQLTATHDLQVAPAGEVVARKVTNLDQAREELGVNLVLEGSFFPAGDSARISYTLVDTATRRQLHADTLTVPMSDPFALQDQVVASVLRSLEVDIQPQEREALVAHGTSIGAANQLYLSARGYLQNYDRPENVNAAIDLLMRAIAADANYARAYASLGEAYWHKYEQSSDRTHLQQARDACTQAAALDARLGAAQVCLGTLNLVTGEYDAAVQAFRRALELEPTSDAAYRGLARAYQRLNRPADAEATFRQAIRLRPQYWSGHNWLGIFYVTQARYTEAAEAFAEVARLAPESSRGFSNLGAVYVLQGRYADAIPMLKKAMEMRPTTAAYSNLGAAYFYLRRFDDAARTYRQAVDSAPQDYVVVGNLAEAEYWRGQRAEAETIYRRAVRLAEEALSQNPRDVAALSGLANYHAYLGEKPKALQYLRRVLALASADPEVLYTAALVHAAFKDHQLAVDFVRKGVAAGMSPSRIKDNPMFDSLRDDPRLRQVF